MSMRRFALPTLLILLFCTGSFPLAVRAQPSSGMHENGSANIAYVGTWTQGSPNSYASGGSFSYSNQLGAYASFTYTGSVVTFIYVTYNNGGSAAVYIDGVFHSPINFNTPEARWHIAKTYSTSYGTHTIRIENTSSNYIYFDAINIGTTPVSGTTIDDRNSNIWYNGSWTTGTFSDAYATTLKWSDYPQAGFLYTFQNNYVSYVYTKAHNRGKAAITIDGVDKGYIDLYSPTVDFQQKTALWELA